VGASTLERIAVNNPRNLVPGLLRSSALFLSLLLSASAGFGQTPDQASSAPAVAEGAADSDPTLILVVGAPGESEYGTNFLEQAQLWQKASAQGHAKTISIGLDDSNSPSDHDRLKQTLEAVAPETPQPLWLVFIGHGTFDGKEARFNLKGPDVSADELADWLKPLRRPLVFIDTSSASAPFLNKLSATNRIIVTATRSGNELNFARFGQFFAQALTNPDSDLDKDGQVSVLEAFLFTSARVAEFYKSDGRLATEHALLDDNGDGLGTPADWFRGVRPVKKPDNAAAVDGRRAQQISLILSQEEQKLPPEIRAKRDAIELAIAHLRDQKPHLPEQQYYQQLDKLFADLLHAYGDHL
jgi:hypothetical protein